MFIFTVRGEDAHPYRFFFETRDQLETSAEYLNMKEFLSEPGERVDIIEMTDEGARLLETHSADM